MMNFNELDARTVRERVNMSQLWAAWIVADDLRRHSFLGSMGWETRAGHEYLYTRKRGVVKSLGRRSAETEHIQKTFVDGKTANAARLASLAAEMNRQAAVLRSLSAGRLPVMAARVLRAFRTHDKGATIRVIGTAALYAYESLAGVSFNAESTATGDVDILVDDRNRLRLLTEDDQMIGLTRLVQSAVDRTFQSRGTMDFRLVNDKSYMVEFVRPEPRPSYRSMPGAVPLETGDIRPAPITGLQWLVNAPAVETIVIDERGYPAPIRCPDPRFWVAHKLWLAMRYDRDPEKKIRDGQQANIMIKLITERLPQFPLDDSFRKMLPRDLSDRMVADPTRASGRPSW